MTINRGLWVPINTGNVGTTEVEARLADDALFESNTGTDARSGVLAPQGTVLVSGKSNMSYDLAACDPVINRVSGEGVYRFTATGVTNVATTAAPAANSRIDVIWVKQNDQSKGDADNKAVVGVTQGTVAASPVAPAIPAGALEIARATVGPNITATTSASITQTFRYTALRGTPIPVRNTTERAEITSPRLGQKVQRLDLGGEYYDAWDGSAWRSTDGLRHAEYTGSIAVGVSQLWGVGQLAVDPAMVKPAGDSFFSVPVADAVFLPEPGSYDLHIRLRLSAAAAAGQTIWASVRDSSSGTTYFEYDSYDWTQGTAAGSITIPNLLVTAAGGQNVYIRLWSTQSGLTITSRVRVEKNT